MNFAKAPSFCEFVTVTSQILLMVLLTACSGQGNHEVKADTDQQILFDTTDDSKVPTPGGYSGALPDYGWAAESQDPTAGTFITNLREIAATTGVMPYLQKGWRGQGQRIAIFDNGFSGFNDAIESGRLPTSVRYIPGRSGSHSADTAHGTKLAELVHGLAPNAQLFLFNTNGYSNFVRAIDEAIARNITTVVYAQVWEYGGNFNGGGFINREVNRAIDRGILWFNAAGNYGISTWEGFVTNWSFDGSSQSTGVAAQTGTYRSQITPSRDGRRIAFHLPAPGEVKLVLTWDDFSESKDYVTREDFDLIIEDVSGREIVSSRLIQDGVSHGLDSKYSNHARELIRTHLPQGTWFARIESKDPTTLTRQPYFRFSVAGLGAQVLEELAQNSVMIPGDNPRVVTVGATDSADSSRGVRTSFAKPDLMTSSRLFFADNQSVVGSSAATAIAAATIAVWQSAYQPLDAERFRDYLQAGYFGNLVSNTDTATMVPPAFKLRLASP